MRADIQNTNKHKQILRIGNIDSYMTIEMHNLIHFSLIEQLKAAMQDI